MSDQEKLNLLFIFTDQQRADTMAAYGNLQIEVPNLNKLAREAVVFERAYVTQPICTPSRSSIMTGLYPHNTGCVRNNVPLPRDVYTLVELADFKEYRKCYIGKWHLGDEVFCQHGFDDWISIEDQYRRYYRSGRDRFAHSSYHNWLVKNGLKPPRIDEDGFKYWSRRDAAELPEEFSKPWFEALMASQFIRKCARTDTPFILYVNFLAPHSPLEGPREDQYDPEDVTLPENFYNTPAGDSTVMTATLTSEGKSLADKEVLFAAPLRTGSQLKLVKTRALSEMDWRRRIAKYWGRIGQVDTAVGKILSTIRECGLEDNTVIVFTSDHGDMMGSHQLSGKGVLFEEAVRVPLLIKIPGVRARAISEPVSQVDIVPTLLDIMGKPIPNELDGYSWKPINVFIEWFPSVQQGHVDHLVRTIITPDGWKFNWGVLGRHELYNLKEDPLESTNLASDRKYHSLMRRLVRDIQSWQDRTRDIYGMVQFH